MRIGILASGSLGLKVLRECEDIIAPVFIATDTKSKEIIRYAKSNSIPLFVGNPRNGSLKNFLNKIGSINIAFSINYLFLIEKDVIASIQYIINFHGSLLPKYRGRTPHVWAIINNEEKTGVTAHLIDENCDTGAIIAQKQIAIDKEDTGNDVLEKFKEIYPEMLREVWTKLKIRTSDFILSEQSEIEATYFGKRNPSDGNINWNWQKERIRNWVRAQAFPYPGAFSHIDGEKIIIDKIIFSSRGFDYNTPNGYILEDNPVIVKTPNGTVELISIRENRKYCKKNKIFEYDNRKQKD